MLASSPLRAQEAPPERLPPAAARHFDAGMAAYTAGRFADASRRFADAYDLAPRPFLLFAWAQAERMGGHCAAATDLYHRFLDSAPPPQQAAKARRQIARCASDTSQESDAAAPRGPAPPGSEPPFAPPHQGPSRAAPPRAALPPALPAPLPARPAAGRVAWYRDAWTVGLLASGAGGLGAGGALLWAAHSAGADADRATSYGAFRELAERADRRRWWGVGALAAGGVLVTAGLVRHALLAPAGREGVAVSIDAGPGALAITAGGPF